MRLHIILPSLAVLLFISACGNSGGGGAADSTSAAAGDSLTADVPANLERGEGPIQLALRFRKGDAFGYAIKTTQNVAITSDTIVDKSVQTMTYRYRFDVLDTLSDGSARLRATCLAMRFEGEYESAGTKKSMRYDSGEKNDPAKEKMFMQYAACVGAPFEIVLSPQGRIERVGGTDAVIQRLLGADRKTMSSDAVAKVTADYSENGLKGIVQQAFQKLPERPVAADSLWKHSWGGTLGFLRLQNDATYTLKGFQQRPEGRAAIITAKMTSRYTGDKRLDTGQGMATVHAFDVSGSGLTVFDLAAGRPASRAIMQKVYAKFFVEPPAELKQVAPDQAKDFWWIQEATIGNTVETIKL